MLCKCGKEAIEGSKWCSETYHQCPAYKLSLSEKAKLRGNNGVKGRLSKKYTEEDLITKEYELVCSICKEKYKKNIKGATVHRSTFIPICPTCVNNKVSISISNLSAVRIQNTPYEQLANGQRKLRVWLEQGQKCNHCGFNLHTIENGPYELHHIDGNANNKSRNNEEVICCNCHAMTDNFRFKGRNHKDPKKSEKFGGIYTQFEKWKASSI